MQIKEKTSYFRNRGVVRSSAEQAQDKGPIEGFLQYDRNNTNADKNADPMQLVYLRDRATALTSQPYNASDTANNVLNYQYITNSATGTYDITKTITTETQGSSSGGNQGQTINPSYSGLVPNENLNNYQVNAFWDRIFYADVPAGAKLQFAVTNSAFNTNDSSLVQKRTMSNYDATNNKAVPTAVDGMCYRFYCTAEGQEQRNYSTSISGSSNFQDGNYKFDNLPGLGSNSDNWVRVYFYYVDYNNCWGTLQNDGAPYIHTWDYENAGTNSVPDYVTMTSIRNATGYTVSGSGSGSSEPSTTTEEVQYSRYNGGVYLNLHNGSSYESSAKKTVSMYYDAGAELFKAYVPRSWLSSGYDVHYNQLQGYYSLGSDELRWSTGEAVRTDPGYVYTVLGYSEANTLSVLAAGAVGVGTWDNVRRMAYSTELLNLTSGGSQVYKTGVSSALYPMVPDPDDDLHFTYWAYVPESGLASQSTNHALRFARYDSYSSGTLFGVWYPQENITYKETTYYAADSTATDDNSASTAKRGWFHVAVFVDGTFENIVYDTLYSTKAVNGAKLEYSIDNGSTYQSIVTTSVSGSSVTANESADMFRIGNTRWVVPIGADTRQVKFRWTPYSGTQFDYNVNTEVGFYCVVTESAISY